MPEANAQPTPCGAVFFDRDGTLIRDTGYLHDPALVELLPGVKDTLHELRAHGFLLFLFTNRLYYAHATGIAKGIRDGMREEGTYDEFLFAGIARKKGGTAIAPVVLIFAVLTLVGFGLAYVLVSSPYFVLPTIPV